MYACIYVRYISPTQPTQWNCNRSISRIHRAPTTDSLRTRLPNSPQTCLYVSRFILQHPATLGYPPLSFLHYSSATPSAPISLRSFLRLTQRLNVLITFPWPLSVFPGLPAMFDPPRTLYRARVTRSAAVLRPAWGFEWESYVRDHSYRANVNKFNKLWQGQITRVAINHSHSEQTSLLLVGLIGEDTNNLRDDDGVIYCNCQMSSENMRLYKCGFKAFLMGLSSRFAWGIVGLTADWSECFQKWFLDSLLLTMIFFVAHF